MLLLIGPEIWQPETLTQKIQNKVLFKIPWEAHSDHWRAPCWGRSELWQGASSSAHRACLNSGVQLPPSCTEAKGLRVGRLTAVWPPLHLLLLFSAGVTNDTPERLGQAYKLCCVCTEGNDTDANNQPWEHSFVTLFYLIFINPKFSHLSKKWMDWTWQKVPLQVQILTLLSICSPITSPKTKSIY